MAWFTLHRGDPSAEDMTRYFEALAQVVDDIAPRRKRRVALVFDGFDLRAEDYVGLFGFAGKHRTFLREFRDVMVQRCRGYYVVMRNPIFNALVRVVTTHFKPQKPLVSVRRREEVFLSDTKTPMDAAT